MGNFYTRLSYSFGNEDWETEKSALQIQPDSSVLCVTASGDRPLNLLSTECKQIVTIDANPIQNALFDLKKAALKHFDYDDYIAFLGLTPMEQRWQHYDKLKDNLSPQSQALWQEHHTKVKNGVLFSGAVEKLGKTSATVANFFRRKKIEQLLSFDDLDEQIAFVEKEFDTKGWEILFNVVHTFRRFLQDPGLYEYVDPSLHVGKFLHSRISRYLKHSLAKESALLNLLLTGAPHLDHLPPYLCEERSPLIKQRLDRISFETIDLLSYLEQAPENHFDRFSMSDVASYIPKQAFNNMIKNLVRVAKPGSRFCIRQFLSNYDIPKDLQHFFNRDSKLEEQLEHQDNCFVYRFMTGEVIK